MLIQKVTGPVGSVTARIWSCKLFTGPTSYICIVFALLLGCKFLLLHEAKYCNKSWIKSILWNYCSWSFWKCLLALYRRTSWGLFLLAQRCLGNFYWSGASGSPLVSNIFANICFIQKYGRSRLPSSSQSPGMNRLKHIKMGNEQHLILTL